MLQQLRQQEQSLVEAQAQQLAQLHAQLTTDTRCLLNSIELQTFITHAQVTPARIWWNRTEPPPSVNDCCTKLPEIAFLLFLSDNSSSALLQTQLPQQSR